MDALDVLKVCLRRWYVVVPVIIVSVAAGLGLALQQQPTYTAFASYALIFHSSGTRTGENDPREANPLAGDGAVLLGEALVADFMSGASQATYGGVGHSGTPPKEAKNGTSYSVSLPDGSQSYLVQTWGQDREGLRAVVDSILNAAPMHAAQIQDRAGAPRPSQYTTFVTGSTQLLELPSTSKLKLIVALLGVGILAGSALSLVVDRALRSRSDRVGHRVSQVRTPPIEHLDMAPSADDSPRILRETVPTSGDMSLQHSVGEPQSVSAPHATPEPEDATRLESPLIADSEAEAERGGAEAEQRPDVESPLVADSEAEAVRGVDHAEAEQRPDEESPLVADSEAEAVRGVDHAEAEQRPEVESSLLVEDEAQTEQWLVYADAEHRAWDPLVVDDEAKAERAVDHLEVEQRPEFAAGRSGETGVMPLADLAAAPVPAARIGQESRHENGSDNGTKSHSEPEQEFESEGAADSEIRDRLTTR